MTVYVTVLDGYDGRNHCPGCEKQNEKRNIKIKKLQKRLRTISARHKIEIDSLQDQNEKQNIKINRTKTFRKIYSSSSNCIRRK